MKRLLKRAVIVATALAVTWGAARALLEVQLPDRSAARGIFPDPMVDLTLRQAFQALPSAGSEARHLRFLEGNAEAWAARWRLLADARHSIDISYFILKQDVFGAAFLGHLLRKAAQGVRVRILLDAVGLEMSRGGGGADYLDVLVHADNVRVRMYRPLRYRLLDTFLTLNPAAILASDHDKILLVDGSKGLTGGRNISREYFTPLADSPHAFHDADVLVAGAAAGRGLRQAFEAQFEGGEAHGITPASGDSSERLAALDLAYRAMDAWLKAEPLPPEVASAIADRGLPWRDQLRGVPGLRGVLGQAPPVGERAPVRLLDSRTRLVATDDPITRSLIRLIRSARREVFIMSPYLVLFDDAARVLAEAAGRGVRITIVTNGPLSSDNALSQALFFEQWPKLLARVPSLRLFVGGDRHNLHAKLAVIDRRLALIGTYNFEPLSISLNSELVVAVWSRRFAEALLEKPHRLIAAGAPRVFRYRIVLDDHGQPRLHDGRPVIAFGPDDHGRPDQWPAVARYRKWLRPLFRLPMETPLL